MLACLSVCALVGGCDADQREPVALEVPRGYVDRLELELDGRRYGFGPFVGYYLKPVDPADLTRLDFVAFNERSFYTLDLPANAKLFEGQAVLVRLPDVGRELPRGEDRIQPVLFADAPAAWLATRPEPAEAFVHFHSCHDATGPVLVGYWLRHVALAAFRYDMGGRVGPEGPLWHEVTPGVDLRFAHLVEFDAGPRPRPGAQ